MTKTNKMFRAEDEQWKEFKKVCEQQGRTRGEVLREAMQEYINTFKKEEKEMKIINIIELNENGVDAEKKDNPMAVRYFDDNGGDPAGNYDEDNIAGWWIIVDGKLEPAKNANVAYAYRSVDDTTLIKADNLKLDFDKELAESIEVYGNYNYITIDIEKYENEIEIKAGFHKSDGRITEIFLLPEQLIELLQK